MNSYHANLFYYNVGIDFYDHQDIFLEYQKSEYLKTLETLLHENQGLYTYLQMYDFTYYLCLFHRFWKSHNLFENGH